MKPQKPYRYKRDYAPDFSASVGRTRSPIFPPGSPSEGIPKGFFVETSDSPTDLEEAREVIDQLSQIVSEFSVRYPLHTGRIPIPQNGEHPLIAFVRGIVHSMGKNEEKLRELNDQALAASKAKELFLANLSHEVRTPLNGISGMVNLLLDTELTPTQNDYLSTINSSSETLLNVVNDVLDVSKAKSSSLTLRPREFDFPELLKEIDHIYHPLAREKGVEFNIEYEDTLPRYFMGDVFRLKQVLSNLISNALKFTAEGSITVTVDECHRRGNQIDLNVFVEDTGVGIPSKSIKDLFDPFTQADNSMTRTHEGTGLGLSICSSIVGLMQGKIGVKSTVGEGSTFFFRCRLESSTGEELNSNESVFEKLTVPTNESGSSNRVLLVEDKPVNQKVARLMLEKLDYEVTIANDGREAVDIASGSVEFDFICMDVCMPRMDGLEATRRIRSSKSINSNTLIIAMTGLAMKDDLKKCLDAGMDHYLTKPIDLGQLKEMITNRSHSKANGAEQVALVS